MTIDLESEHKYYHHLLELTHGSRGKAALTPIEEGQEKAVIRVFVHKNGDHILLSEIVLDLTGYANPLPNITVSGLVSGKQLILSVAVEGQDIPVKPISLKKFLHGSWKVPLLVAGAALLAALLLLALFEFFPAASRSASPRNSVQSGSETQPLPEPQVEAAESANPVIAAADTPKPQDSVSTAKNAQITNTTIYFYPNSSKLREGELKKLEDTAEFLIRHPGKKVIIEGHCALYGTKEGRLRISRARAEKIRDYLVQKGWKSDEPPLIKWYGASKPVTTDPAQKDKNRRVEIRISDQL